MTNALCVLTYSPFFLVTLILLFVTLGRKDRRPVTLYCACFYACLVAWQICESLCFILKDTWWIQYVFDLKLIFVAFLAIFLFLLMIDFYHLGSHIPRWLTPLLFVIPALTGLLALFSPFHNLLLTGFKVLSLSPVTVLHSVRGVWYYIHTAYSQSLAVIVSTVILLNYRKLPRAYRSGSQFVLAGVAVYFALTAVETFNLDGCSLDFNVLGGSFCGLMFYFSILVNGNFNYLHIERREVFHYLDEGVFILDEKGTVIDANRTALKLFGMPDRQPDSPHFNTLLAELCASGALTRRQLEDESGEDLCLWGGSFPLFFHMRRQPVYGRGRTPEGNCVILTDVTTRRLFVERLREVAGIDLLTGLPNRYKYQELLRALDRPDCLPLSIIMGDLNGLKAINDTRGHHEGDLLIKTAAGALHACCPPAGHVCRIGGDEFAMLLPGCPPHAAEELIAQIGASIEKIPETFPRPSIAMGCATKTLEDQNINQLIQTADIRMYRNKGEAGSSRVLPPKRRKGGGERR